MGVQRHTSRALQRETAHHVIGPVLLRAKDNTLGDLRRSGHFFSRQVHDPAAHLGILVSHTLLLFISSQFFCFFQTLPLLTSLQKVASQPIFFKKLSNFLLPKRNHNYMLQKNPSSRDLKVQLGSCSHPLIRTQDYVQMLFL